VAAHQIAAERTRERDTAIGQRDAYRKQRDETRSDRDRLSGQLAATQLQAQTESKKADQYQLEYAETRAKLEGEKDARWWWLGGGIAAGAVATSLVFVFALGAL